MWKAFKELGRRRHEAGPLDEKSQCRLKPALSIGAGLEAANSAIQNTSSVGITQDRD